MAKSKDVRRFFLFSFLLISLGLIVTIWFNGVIEKEVARPGYYRNTLPVNEAYYMTVTAIYYDFSLGTPMPTKEAHSDHESENIVEVTPATPSPTIDWDAEEQDN